MYWCYEPRRCIHLLLLLLRLLLLRLLRRRWRRKRSYEFGELSLVLA